jgi:peptidoglycan/LPS O-acetylase OafA/YrhL
MPALENDLVIKTHQRIFGLDILRFLAIIVVVAAHGRYLVADTVLYEFPYISFFDGVDLFFVLSGFLIGTLLLKEISREQKFAGTELITFWKRRWFRTLPNYYLILLVNFIITSYHFTAGDASYFNWKFIFFLQNFTHTVGWFFIESWSLTIEEWFYIFGPLLLILALKLLQPKWAFLVTVVSLLLFSLFYRFYTANCSGMVDFELYENISKVVVTRLDAIGYGLLAAWFAFYYNNRWQKSKIICCILGSILLYVLSHDIFIGSFLYRNVYFYSLSPFALMLFLPLAYSIKTVNGVIGKCVTHISKISYSMYLVNLGIVSELIKHNFPVQSVTDGIIKFILYWIIVIVLSSIIYRFYEKPMMDWRDKFPFKKKL